MDSAQELVKPCKEALLAMQVKSVRKTLQDHCDVCGQANKDRHFTLHKAATLIWCENRMNRNINVLFFHESCVKLGSCDLELQLLGQLYTYHEICKNYHQKRKVYNEVFRVTCGLFFRSINKTQNSHEI